MKNPVEVRVYTDYTPVRIFSCLEGDPQTEADRAGLVGKFTVLGEGDRVFPDRQYRESWVFRGGRVVEDEALKANIQAKRAQESQNREAVKSKLGLSDEEIKILQGREK